jgi:uncharacterized protein (DUF302 family)
VKSKTGLIINLIRGLLAMSLLAGGGAAIAAETLKPYILAFETTGDMQEKVDVVKGALQAKGFEVVGDYVPFENAHIIVVTSDALKQIAAKNKLGGFAAPQRVSVSKVGDKIQVAYTNPVYMAHAYRLNTDMADVAKQFESAIGKVQEFGAKGLTEKKLRKYHYTFGMEYFDDVYKLGKYGSHQEAVEAVEKKLASNTVGIGKVYRIDIPGKEQTVFGVSMKGPTEEDKFYDDAFQMSVVDFEGLKQTAYLPYEVMVEGNEVVALHMRFRMAVNFPDLKMMGGNSFMVLMPSPTAIENALIAAIGN